MRAAGVEVVVHRFEELAAMLVDRLLSVASAPGVELAVGALRGAASV